jgi:hypothetical protein
VADARDRIPRGACQRAHPSGLHATWCRARAVERGTAGDFQPRGIPERHSAGQSARRTTAPAQPAARGRVQAD